MTKKSDPIDLKIKIRNILLPLTIVEVIVIAIIVMVKGIEFIEPVIFVIVLIFGIEIDIILDSLGIRLQV